MDKPRDVSEAAWEFAVQYAYPHPSEPTAQTYQRRIALARAFDDAAKPLREANVLFVRWMEEEDKGPQYPFGMTRDSEGGEEFWRKWWDENAKRCRDAVDSAKATHPRFTPEDE